MKDCWLAATVDGLYCISSKVITFSLVFLGVIAVNRFFIYFIGLRLVSRVLQLNWIGIELSLGIFEVTPILFILISFKTGWFTEGGWTLFVGIIIPWGISILILFEGISWFSRWVAGAAVIGRTLLAIFLKLAIQLLTSSGESLSVI